jgi:dTDP-4-dehydrorhamnose 3,5-epimerase
MSKLTNKELIKTDKKDLSVASGKCGYSVEIYRDMKYIQGNIHNHNQDTIYGLRTQLHSYKSTLITCLKGKIYVVAVDIREHSPLFKHWTSVDLFPYEQIEIPAGFAYGFTVRSPDALVDLQRTYVYHDDYEVPIAWNDPEIEIDWDNSDPWLSDVDRNALSLKNALPLLYKM